MRFFRINIFLLALAFTSVTNAKALLETVVSQQMGSCETNNLSFTAMKFYKIPLDESHEGRPVYLRILFFFNNDSTVIARFTKQVLISCQRLPSGDEACAYQPLEDVWFPIAPFVANGLTVQTDFGVIEWIIPENSNRGFQITLNGESFMGGMVLVNFNQHGTNTAKICPK